MDGLPKTVIETCSPTSTDTLSWASKEESCSRVYALWYLPLSTTGCLRSYTISIQASTEWKPLLAGMSGGPTSTQTLKGRWRLATTVQECATLRWWHHFSHGHGLHDLGRECISTMLSIKGNISSWPEIFTTTKTTTEKTISILRHLFSSYGFPEEIVSDSGPQFTSDQFADFLRQNGVRHTRSAPYHPATNRAAERMVPVLKKGLKLASRLSVDHQLTNLLLSYRSMPHSTTGMPPAELFLKQQLRTRLTLLKPDQQAAVRRKQVQQKQQHNQNSKQMRTFRPGDHVAVLQFRGSEKWVPGIVVQALGPVAYMVNVNNRIVHVHVDHLVAAPPCAPLPNRRVTSPS